MPGTMFEPINFDVNHPNKSIFLIFSGSHLDDDDVDDVNNNDNKASVRIRIALVPINKKK